MENGTKGKTSKLVIVQTILLAAILVILLVLGAVALRGFGTVQKNMEIIERDLQELDMDEINDTIVSLNTAATSLGQIDMDSLNELIGSLKTTAQTLQGISDAFSSIGSFFGGSR